MSLVSDAYLSFTSWVSEVTLLLFQHAQGWGRGDTGGGWEAMLQSVCEKPTCWHSGVLSDKVDNKAKWNMKLWASLGGQRWFVKCTHRGQTAPFEYWLLSAHAAVKMEGNVSCQNISQIQIKKSQLSVSCLSLSLNNRSPVLANCKHYIGEGWCYFLKHTFNNVCLVNMAAVLLKRAL